MKQSKYRHTLVTPRRIIALLEQVEDGDDWRWKTNVLRNALREDLRARLERLEQQAKRRRR